MRKMPDFLEGAIDLHVHSSPDGAFARCGKHWSWNGDSGPYRRERRPFPSAVQRRKKPIQTFPSRGRSIFLIQPSGASVLGSRSPRPLTLKSMGSPSELESFSGGRPESRTAAAVSAMARSIRTFEPPGNSMWVGKWVAVLRPPPVNPRFAPVIHPTLETGVETLVVAAQPWLSA